MNFNKLLSAVFNPKNAYIVTILFIVVFYSVPSLLMYFGGSDEYFCQLFFISVLGVLGLFIGANLKVMDGFFIKKKISINPKKFVNFFIFIFIIDIFLVIYVRPEIPLLNAIFHGLSQEELSAQRGYLKNAGGLAFFVNYLNVLLLTSFIPLCIGISFYYNLKVRNLLAIGYIFFAILFLQKALFISALLPILVAMKLKNKLNFSKLFSMLTFIFLLIIALTSLSIDNEYSYIQDQNIKDFYSVNYETTGVLDFLAWRSIGIPVATAVDTLRVFDQYLNNQFLFGATSSLFALIFGFKRINIEQMVFAYQFSDINTMSEDSIGRANSIYIVDSYINFSWIGVFLVSLIVGLIYRGFWKSSEKVWAVLFLLFLMQITSVGFIGIMLSGGYLFIILLMLNFEFKASAYRIK